MERFFVRRLCLALASSAWLSLAIGTPARAQPVNEVKKVTRLVVPAPAGSAADRLARMIGERLATLWRHTVVIDNQPGGNGALAAETVARVPANGQTLLWATAGVMVIHPVLSPKPSYNASRDFQPISLLAKAPLVLVAQPQLAADTFAEFVNAARTRPQPLRLGHAGVGTEPHLAGHAFAIGSALKVEHVALPGSVATINALLGGDVDALFELVATVLPLVKAGRLRPLAVASRRRLPILPSVPTLGESALPGFEAGTWYGIVAPVGLPADDLVRLHGDVVRVLTLQEVHDTLIDQGLEPVGSTPAVFDAWMQQEAAKHTRLARAAGLTP
jgi:tripartite-type tricarboxylate transporter receptor subunit TctC